MKSIEYAIDCLNRGRRSESAAQTVSDLAEAATLAIAELSQYAGSEKTVEMLAGVLGRPI